VVFLPDTTGLSLDELDRLVRAEAAGPHTRGGFGGGHTGKASAASACAPPGRRDTPVLRLDEQAGARTRRLRDKLPAERRAARPRRRQPCLPAARHAALSVPRLAPSPSPLPPPPVPQHKYMLTGEFEHYHGEAVNPKHLSLWERWVLGGLPPSSCRGGAGSSLFLSPSCGVSRRRHRSAQQGRGAPRP
jgi:hypothetical protein